MNDKVDCGKRAGAPEKMTKVHRSEFLKQLKATFPAVELEINKEQGLLHFEMAVFRRLVQQLIDSGDREQVTKAYKLAEWAYENGNDDLKNAIDVSFVEELNFNDTKKHKRQWARSLLPCTLAKLYEAWLLILHGPKSAK
ncbi:MAG: hypothetical protein EPN97_12400 [Alphaproteobacteria bacterium]|nr:MAG: hypothetical protein EPN97_12400 [Alphaproteobacteria bacterium]